MESEILLQRSTCFLWIVRYFFRNRDTSVEIEMLLVGILSLVAGYFTFVAGSFCRVVVHLQFALSQPLSYNTKPKQGYFPYSDNKYGVRCSMCSYMFSLFFHNPDLFHLGGV